MQMNHLHTKVMKADLPRLNATQFQASRPQKASKSEALRPHKASKVEELRSQKASKVEA